MSTPTPLARRWATPPRRGRSAGRLGLPSIDLVAGTPASGGANVCVDLLSTQLLRPHGCCLDPQGLLVIADSDNDRIIAGEISAVKSR
jgi:hypothetical protein